MEWVNTHALCGITDEETVSCWPGTPSPVPLQADDDYRVFDLAAAGWACLVHNSDQQVECRPLNNLPAQTIALSAGEYVDVAVAGFDNDVEVCGVTTDHALRCHDGTDETVEPGEWVRIEALDIGFCGIRVDGSIQCFATPSEITNGVPSGTDFVDLQTSNQAVCAVRSSGSVVCWSRNDDSLDSVPASLR